MKALYLIFQMF